jgi:hypothetical protein
MNRDQKGWVTRSMLPASCKLSEGDQSWLKAQLRRGLAFTVLSAACGSGQANRRSGAEKPSESRISAPSPVS